jgi:hypothetical protein
MTSTFKSQRQKILNDTNAFSELITNKDWSTLEERVKVRQSNLDNLFAKPIPDSEKSVLLDFVSQLQALDEKHKLQIAKTKLALAKETTSIKNKYKAVKAYSSVNEQ